LLESLLLNGHATAGLRRRFLKFSEEPVTGGANPALRIILI
jgi:hypothetical protein